MAELPHQRRIGAAAWSLLLSFGDLRKWLVPQRDITSGNVVRAIVTSDADSIADMFQDAAGAGGSVLLAAIEKRNLIAREQFVCGSAQFHRDPSLWPSGGPIA